MQQKIGIVFRSFGHAIIRGAVKSISQAAYCFICSLTDILLLLFILLYGSYRNTRDLSQITLAESGLFPPVLEADPVSVS